MTRLRLARALGVLAVLAVVGTSITALAAYRGRGGPTAEVSLVHAFAGGRVVVGDGAAFEVPARGWTVETSDVLAYYVDRSGDPSVGVRGPAVFRDGFCRQRPHASNRGFAGFVHPVPGASAREATAQVARAWVAAVSLGGAGTPDPHTSLRTDEVRLADGSTAVRATSRVMVRHPEPCEAPAVDVTVASLDTGHRVATFVLVRDAGVRGIVSDALADRIVRSLRPAG